MIEGRRGHRIGESECGVQGTRGRRRGVCRSQVVIGGHGQVAIKKPGPGPQVQTRGRSVLYAAPHRCSEPDRRTLLNWNTGGHLTRSLV